MVVFSSQQNFLSAKKALHLYVGHFAKGDMTVQFGMFAAYQGQAAAFVKLMVSKIKAKTIAELNACFCLEDDARSHDPLYQFIKDNDFSSMPITFIEKRNEGNYYHGRNCNRDLESEAFSIGYSIKNESKINVLFDGGYLHSEEAFEKKFKEEMIVRGKINNKLYEFKTLFSIIEDPIEMGEEREKWLQAYRRKCEGNHELSTANLLRVFTAVRAIPCKNMESLVSAYYGMKENASENLDTEFKITRLMYVSAAIPQAGDTAASLANVVTNHLETVNADVNAMDVFGRTALFYVTLGKGIFPVSSQYIPGLKRQDVALSIFKLLIEKGADSTIKDHLGKTAVDYYSEAFDNHAELKAWLAEQKPSVSELSSNASVTNRPKN